MCFYCFFYYYCFHLKSAHFAINVINFHLQWWPLVFYYCGNVLPMWRQVFAWYARYFCIFFLLPISKRLFGWCVYIQCFFGRPLFLICVLVFGMFSFTKWFCIITALCIVSVLIYKSGGGTIVLHFNATQYFFINLYNFT